MKKNEVSKEEKVLIMAGLKFAQKVGMPMTKLAWGLSTIIGKPDNVLYHKVRETKRLLENDVELEELDDIRQIETEVTQHLEEEEMNQDLAEEELEKRVGDIVKVRVVSVKSYGAICTVEGTVRTLLLHLSEVADEFIDDMSAYVMPGDEFYAMIIVNPKGQLGLSTRRVAPLKRRYGYRSANEFSEGY